MTDMTRDALNDPDWAWSPFEPSQAVPWDLKAVAHLFRRAGFAANRNQLEASLKSDPANVVGQLVANREPEAFQNQMKNLVRAGLASGNVEQLAAQWIYRMLSTPAQLLEKTTLFWHGHFATSAAKVDDAELIQTQNDLLRHHALGDFSTLLLEISRDPAMLLYLDSASNRKSHPNENYAREIMELFCLGEGNYTETDVRELARCFTGWEIKRKKFRFNRYQHDRGEKSVLGQSGQLGGEEGVAIVSAQDNGPRFIVRKLIQFFVMDEPVANDTLIEPLAVELRENDFRIQPTVQRILESNLFFSTRARGRRVRSPIEFSVGFLRALDGSTDSYKLAAATKQLGQGLYYPPSVKGWDGGRTWINSSTLLGRANLIRQLLDSGKTRFGKTTLAEYLDGHGVRNPSEMLDWIEPMLFAVTIPGATRDRIREMSFKSVDAGKNGRDQALKDALHILCSLPEFQLA